MPGRAGSCRRAARLSSLAVAAATVLAAGCGADTGPGPANLTPPAKATIVLGDDGYRPERLTVPAGTRVTWVNGSETDNTVETEGVGFFEYDRRAMARRGQFDLHILSGAEAESIVFDRPGVYWYGSSLDEQMVGRLTVTSEEDR